MSSRWEVPFVNYPEHYFRIWDDVRGAIDRCLQKGDLILRDDVESFERSLAGSLRCRHAIGLNSGTDALWFGLKALGIGPKDEVIIPAHTFVASAAAVVHCGAKPVLVDIGEDMCMDMDSMEAAFSKRTRAVMPVHLNGRCCNMDYIKNATYDWGKKIGQQVHVVEDAAQALGAKFMDYYAGAWGAFSAFSFYPAKILGCAGDGGALVTNSDIIAHRVELLRDHAMNRAHKNILFGYGYNSRLDNLQAAILNAKLKYLKRWLDRRRKIAGMYCAGLEGIDSLKLPHFDREDLYFDVYQNYVIRSEDRNALESFLREHGVETMVSWRVPLHQQSSLDLGHYDLPVTEEVSNTCLSLPMYPELSDSQVNYVVEQVCSFLA